MTVINVQVRRYSCYLEDGFDKGQLKSLSATSKMVEGNGGKVFTGLEAVAEYLNND